MNLLKKLIGEGRAEQARIIYPGKTNAEIRGIMFGELKKKAVPVIAVSVLLIAFTVSLGGKNDPYKIIRNDVNGESKTVDIRLETPEEVRNESLTVSAFEMTDEEIDLMQGEIEKYFDEAVFKGKFEIFESIDLPGCISGYPVFITWNTDAPSVLSPAGVAFNEELKEAKPVLVTGKVMYGSEFRIYEKNVMVMPKEYPEKEQIFKKGMGELKNDEMVGRNEREFIIPETVLGMKVSVEGENMLMKTVLILLLIIGLFTATILGYFSEVKKKRQKRISEAEEKYKDFVSKLMLYLTAGLSVRGAWKRLSDEFSGGKDLLGDMLTISENELQSGEYEADIYERFGNSMESVMYRRLGSILSQQVTKGVANLTLLLSKEVAEAVAKERERIKVKSALTGTKLLIPMMGMLVIVFAILLMPALTSF